MNRSLPPLLAIGAYSGTGKTTLLKQQLDLNQPESIADFIVEWLKGAA
ncbi:hypothetical protein ACTVKI_20540 [Serratia marcescens]|nr:hypothetical protein [Serratia marcescens]